VADARTPAPGSCDHEAQETARVRLQLHHTGIAVRDIATTADVYVRSLGFELRTGIIHDPTQQAYVQFLRLPGDQAYVELVQPDRPEAKLSQAVAKGGGLNHLCYSVDDIEAACRVLAERGLFVIAPPAPAVAFDGRRIAWLIGKDVCLTELVERGGDGDL
jgi:methylmalonyl-CoA/ethylmalonyl-CoA epimerase